jgi:tRNA (mo5U34)-methyltransferase
MRAELAGLGPWFHNLHLPDGTQTVPNHPLGDFPAFKWRAIEPHIPADLTGWTVLDVGCNAGFYSFELAKRGALVTAIDVDPQYLRQAEWAAAQFGLQDRVTFHQMQVYDLAHTPDVYDLVWFMGVLYHLRYPVLGLDIVTRKAKRSLVFQTLTMPGEEVLTPPENLDLFERNRMREAGWPKMAFIEHRLADDPTNWWAANHACVEALLRSCGMRVVSRPAHEIYICEPERGPPSELETLLEEEYLAATGQSAAAIKS